MAKEKYDYSGIVDSLNTSTAQIQQSIAKKEKESKPPKRLITFTPVNLRLLDIICRRQGIASSTAINNLLEKYGKEHPDEQQLAESI